MMPETMHFGAEHGLRLVRMVIDGIVLCFVIGSPDRMRQWRGVPALFQRSGRLIVGIEDAMEMPFFIKQLQLSFGVQNPMHE